MNVLRNTAIVALMLVSSILSAQSKMEETMFASGKIYTFLAVALVILGGMFFYLFRLDIRLNKIEKAAKELKKGEE